MDLGTRRLAKGLFWCAHVVCVTTVYFQTKRFHELVDTSPHRPVHATGQIYRVELRGPDDIYVTGMERLVANFWIPWLSLLLLWASYLWLFGVPNEDERVFTAIVAGVIFFVMVFFFPSMLFQL